MLSKIFHGTYLRRLDNIIQWQEKDTFIKENVSSHSFKVAVFARILLEDIFGDCEDKDVLEFKLKVTTAALFHDFDEALLMRDISHELKYNSYNGSSIRLNLNEYVKDVICNEFDSDVERYNDNKHYTHSVNMLRNSTIECDSTVKLFVKYCDWLAMLFYCKRELDLNNISFKQIYQYCTENLDKLGKELIQNLKKDFPNISKEFNLIIQKLWIKLVLKI